MSRLREHLRVSARELELWLSGAEKPPMDVFLKAVDLISADPAPRFGSGVLKRAYELRQKSRELAGKASEARGRSIAVHRAILQRQAEWVARHAVSALAFLESRFAPTDGRQMIEAALDAALGAMQARMGNVQILSAGALRIVTQRGFEQPFLDFFARVDAASPCACGAAVRAGQRIVVPDVANDPIFAGTPAAAAMAQAGVRAVQSTPLVGQSGRVFGMLSTHCGEARDFTPRELDSIDHIARRAAFWLEGGVI